LFSPKSRRDIFREQAEAHIFDFTFHRFQTLKVRSKISFHACKANKTVVEHILDKIMATLKVTKKAGLDDFDSDEDEKFESLFP